MRRTVLLLIIILSGCIVAERQANPAISKVKRLYRANCSLCHRLYQPDLYPYQKLEKYVEKYGKGLTAEEREDLLRYLKEASKE